MEHTVIRQWLSGFVGCFPGLGIGVRAPSLNWGTSFPKLSMLLACVNPCMITDNENFRCSAVMPTLLGALSLFSVETCFVTSF